MFLIVEMSRADVTLDAMDAYDAWVVAKSEPEELKPSELNRPEKYARLFQKSSDSEGDGSEADGCSARKKGRKRKSSR